MEIKESPLDYGDLKKAVNLLTSPGLLAKVTNLVGTPLEYTLKKLPKSARDTINEAVKSALSAAADAALWTMDNKPQSASTISHKVYAGLAGAVGGLGGLTTLALELPVTTTIMLRSIADIARSEGFDLADEKTKEECIKVFGLGGDSKSDDGAETGYYAARGFMSRTMEHLAKDLPAAVAAAAAKKAGEEASKQAVAVSTSQASKYLTDVIQKVASRFGIVITEKAALQIAPVLGALTGASINALFTDHFQDMAHGHFTVLRLEKKYGKAAVRQAYDELKQLKKLESQAGSDDVIDVKATEAKAKATLA